MVVITTQCVYCEQPIELPPDVVSVRVIAGRHRWSYICPRPSCGAHIERDADDNTVAVLAKAGITPSTVALPPRPTIDGKTPTGPPITWDDVHAFHDLLEGAL